MTDQLNDSDLESMTAQQVAEAYDTGRLDSLLGGDPDDVSVLDKARRGTDPLTPSDIKHLSDLGAHQLIADAYDANRITHEEN